MDIFKVPRYTSKINYYSRFHSGGGRGRGCLKKNIKVGCKSIENKSILFLINIHETFVNTSYICDYVAAFKPAAPESCDCEIAGWDKFIKPRRGKKWD